MMHTDRLSFYRRILRRSFPFTRQLALLGLLCLAFAWGSAQTAASPGQVRLLCGQAEALEAQPALKALQEDLDARLAAQMATPGNLRPAGNLSIPVVVHVVHQNGPENIPMGQIQDAIDHLNQAFANTGAFDPNTGVAVGIEFCLAVQDESGNLTDGVNRVQSPLTNFTMETQNAQLKALSQWDSHDYLNIWVVAGINSLTAGPGVAGYATLPASHGTIDDGIVVEANYFGPSPDNSKITVHEVGHYLGLYHTFQGGCTNQNCQLDGDRVCDTPPDGSTASAPCSPAPNTCSTDEDDTSLNNPFRAVGLGGLGDQPDPLDNYMDYGAQICQSVFTQGQADRMLYYLQTTRLSLLSSSGCQSPCPNPIVADFSMSPNPAVIGQQVNFTDLSVGATSWRWYWNNLLFSSAQNPNYTFGTPGDYTVKLVIGNGNPNCVDSIELPLRINCTTLAAFSQDDQEVMPGDIVTFTQQSPGATSYQWLLDGLPVGNGPSFTHTFTNLGGNTVCLITGDALCQDTVCQYISVGDCGRNRSRIWAISGSNGLNFATNPPTPIFVPMQSPLEGIASICGMDGVLKGYFNGELAYRGLENPGNPGFGALMPNGDSLYGGWSSSSTQSGIWIPKPLDDSTFYLFTVDENTGALYNNTSGGVSYSVVDLRVLPGAAGIGGDVVQKNIPLMDTCTEKIAAVRHANGCDVWVLTHKFNSQDFYAYLVTPDGVDTNAVISTVGFPHALGFLNFNQPPMVNAQGQMKFSPDGSHVALVLQDTLIVEILDFDKSTGVLSNPIDFQVPGFISIYGVEFSPDGSKVYATETFGGNKVWQLDLNAGSPAAVVASATHVGSTIGTPGGLQLAPNGKIYGSRFQEKQLFVIGNPNAAGAACNFSLVGPILNNNALFGMPSIMADYAFVPEQSAHGPEFVCGTQDHVRYYFDQLSCSDTVYWTLVGDAAISGSDPAGIFVDFYSPGQVQLMAEAVSACGTSRDTLNITVTSVTVPDIGPDTSICVGNSLLLDPGGPFATLLWSDGSTNATLTATQSGTYWVQTTDANGCPAADTVLIAPSGQPVVDLGPDDSLCPGGVLQLNAGSGFAAYTWSDLSLDSSTTIWAAGTYWVQVEDYCGLIASDTVVIYEDLSFQVDLGPDTVICAGDQIVLNGGAGATYIWQDGSNMPTYTVSGPGTFHVEVTNAAGCYARDTVQVDPCVAILNGWSELVPVLYPNPTSGLSYLSFGQPVHAPVRIRLMDMLGQAVLENVLEEGLDGPWPLDARHLAQGMYLLEIQVGDSQFAVRLAVE